MAYIITFVLILFSALFSGLTLGLMSLDVHALNRKIKLGNKQAATIYKVRKNGNLLLTTLLLGNVAVNAFLAIFLGSIATGVVAGLISTVLIFLFGEIIPQAVISRHAMAFGAKTAWIVQVLIILLYPICAPIAWVLDKLLGHEVASVYSKRELVKVIEEHEDSDDSDIDRDEERILKGALTFSNKRVGEVMTPSTVMSTVNNSDLLDYNFLKSLREVGHSRFPVYDKKQKVVGLLYLRDLVGRDLGGKTVKNIARKDVKYVQMDSMLDDVLNLFLRTRLHLFIVVDEFGGVEGLITVEDILEEIVGLEIVDEFDKYTDMRKVARDKTHKKGKRRKKRRKRTGGKKK